MLNFQLNRVLVKQPVGALLGHTLKSVSGNLLGPPSRTPRYSKYNFTASSPTLTSRILGTVVCQRHTETGHNGAEKQLN